MNGVFPYFYEYDRCCVCPKMCGVNRNAGERGFCRETGELKLAWAGLHFGEEPPIAGKGGSGTVFVTGCNLRCAFCQNYQISREGMGRVTGQKEFADICLELEKNGAENINVVTGSHAAPVLIAFLKEAKRRGLSVPVVWNTSAYETVQTVEALAEVVDIWLPDIKTFSKDTAQAAFRCPDYPEAAVKAILKMAEISALKFDFSLNEDDYPFGKMLSGVIVRHLALPSKFEESRTVVEWFGKKLKDKALLSLMTQYTPIKKALRKNKLPFEERFLNEEEDLNLRFLLSEFGIENGFYQELVTSSEWLPDFEKVQPFSSELAKPLWHWSALKRGAVTV